MRNSRNRKKSLASRSNADLLSILTESYVVFVKDPANYWSVEYHFRFLCSKVNESKLFDTKDLQTSW